MARDFRDSPDWELMEPDSCGHNVSFLGAGIDCGKDADHQPPHVGYVDGVARRSGLGTIDDVKRLVAIEWTEGRPPATVGDVRRIIRESRGEA